MTGAMTSIGPRLVVFDVDGTLVDSQDHIVGAMTGAFASAGLPAPSRAAILSIVGLSLPEAVAMLVPALGATDRDKIVDLYKGSFTRQRGVVAPAPLFPGATAALRALSARPDIRLGVATGKSRRGLRKLIDDHDLADLFVTCQTADDHPSKPHPAMVHAALAEAGVGPEAAVIIGDTTYDIEMGRAAGIGAIGVGWGYHPAEALVRAGAQQILEDFAGLLPALDRLWGR